MSASLRTLRQKRLREVGEAGQARLFAAHATVAHDGLRGDFTTRYLVGAGVTHLAAPPTLHDAARAIDPAVELSTADPTDEPPVAPAFVLEPAAREAFAGAFDALCIVRQVLRP